MVSAAESEVAPHLPRSDGKPWPRNPRNMPKLPLGKDLPQSASRSSPSSTLPERFDTGMWSSTSAPRAPGSRPGTGASVGGARVPPRQRLGDALQREEAISPRKALASAGSSRTAALTCDIGPLLAIARRNVSAPPTAASNETQRSETFARLATPRTRGTTSERTTRRALAQEFEEYAQQATRDLVPSAPVPERYGPAAFGDIWHTAGEDGYRSAVFHATVRCRELMQSTGSVEIIMGPDGQEQAVFKGLSKNAGPELVRLHAACFLFEELCTVSSPLQDTLRFLLREFCHCIFDSFLPGSDILLLTPFFSIAYQSRQDSSSTQQRAEQAETARDVKGKECAELKRQVEELKAMVQREKDLNREQRESYESLKDERNGLREKLSELQESADLRADELRELSSEFAMLQGSSFQTRRDLELIRKEANATAKESKDQQSTISTLQHKLDDLHDSLAVMHDSDTNEAVPAPDVKPPVELSHELEQEVAIRRKDFQRRKLTPMLPPGEDKRGVDTKRLLKVPVADGGSQMVMKASTEEERGLVELGTSSAIKGQSTVVLVSRAVFATLSIAMGLPRPPDFTCFGAKDDDDIVAEVQAEVQTLARDHRSLLEMFRKLRVELKETLRLIPEWNVDELRGVLRSVLVFDNEEANLVPLPAVGKDTLIGLGEGEEVPPFLRYHGVLRLRVMDNDEVKRCAQEVWLTKTQTALEAVAQGLPSVSLVEFFSVVYIPGREKDRTAQMEFSYNFLHALREKTSLFIDEDDLPQDFGPALEDEGNAGDGGGRGKSKNLHFNPSVHFHTGAEVLYRGLLGELHEDAYHDQSAMLVCLIITLISLSERFLPCHWIPPSSCVDGVGIDENNEWPAVYGLAELSAVFRVFFPAKPREHLSALKQILLAYKIGDDDDCEDSLSRIATVEDDIEDSRKISFEDTRTQTKMIQLSKQSTGSMLKPPGGGTNPASKVRPGGSPTPSLAPSEDKAKGKSKIKKPPMVDVGRVFGVELRQGMIAEKENFLTDLIGRPSPLVQEIRRQHLCECFMFVDRLHKAFRVFTHYKVGEAGGAGREDGSANVTVRQAEAALLAADQYLTEDQKYVYLLRGFGRRLPDAPTAETSAEGLIGGKRALLKKMSSRVAEQSFGVEFGEDSPRSEMEADPAPDSPTSVTSQAFHRTTIHRAAQVYKLRSLLKERVAQLIEGNTTVATDVFIKRLATTGVTKSARAWQPDITPADIVQEAGLVTMRPQTATAPLEEFIQPPSDDIGRAVRRPTVDERGVESPVEEMTSGALGTYRKHVEHGRDVMELGVGYPALVMSYWLSTGL